jgi:N-methylhydantoinase A
VHAFEEAYQREYNYMRGAAAIEIFRLNLTAVGVIPKAELARDVCSDTQAAPRTHRAVTFDDHATPLDTPIYWRDDLPAGAHFDGPAIVDQLDSTTLVPPGARCEVDAWHNLRIHVSGAA